MGFDSPPGSNGNTARHSTKSLTLMAKLATTPDDQGTPSTPPVTDTPVIPPVETATTPVEPTPPVVDTPLVTDATVTPQVFTNTVEPQAQAPDELPGAADPDHEDSVSLHFQITSADVVNGTSGKRKQVIMKPVPGLDGRNMEVSDKVDFGLVQLDITNQDRFDFFGSGQEFIMHLIPVRHLVATVQEQQ